MATNPTVAPTPTSAAATASPPPIGRLATWRYVLNTANLPEGMTHPDAISKWLVITRAAVFSMTATSGLIGACSRSGRCGCTGEVTVNWLYLVLAVVGLVVAHAANNMINDYFDLEGGVDTDDYVRALYAPHPILSGWVTKRQLGHGDPDRELDRPRDHAVPHGRARPAGHRVRPRRACSSRSSTSRRRSGSSITASASRACSSSGAR